MALLTPHDPCFLARGGNPPPLDGPTTAGKPYWPAGLAISWSAGKMRAKVSGEKVLWHLIGLLKNFELEGGGWVIDILHDMHAAEPGSLPRSEKVLHTEQSQCMARRYVAKQRGSHTGRPC